MSHEVEKMFSIEVPWHGLGERIPEVVTAAVGIEKAGHQFEVELRDLFAGKPSPDVNVTEFTGRRATVRVNPDGTERILGVVGGRYAVIQNAAMWAFCETLAATGEAKYETAGTLANGRHVWAMARLSNCRVSIKGKDEIVPYLLITNSHDGTRALTAATIPFRVVCKNTLDAALTVASNAFQIYHVPSWEAQVDQARDALGLAVEYYEKFQDVGDLLASIEFGRRQVIELTENLWPQQGKELSGRRRRYREVVLETWEREQGESPDFADSAWLAYNAVARVADHRPTKGSRERVTQSIIFGGARQRLKNHALDMIATMSGHPDLVRVGAPMNPEEDEEAGNGI